MQTDQLSQDHIQPQCAFNEKHRRYIRMENVQTTKFRQNQILQRPKLRNIYDEIQPDRPISGGIYRYTQCTFRNGYLGEFYDARFGRWCHMAVSSMKAGQILIAKREYIQKCQFPLSILKRIVAMFFSINGDEFAKSNPELSAFVRNSNSTKLPKNFRFFAAYNMNDIVSHIPTQSRLNIKTSYCCTLSQIAHPPFVYVMTLDSESPDTRLTEISNFAGYAYEDQADLDVALRVVSTNNCFAGDFRSGGKVIEDDIAVLVSDVKPSYFRIIDVVL